ncbi:MAG: phosphotransferase, partial [Proteobacteria bacterium]|nr:phosphotransferase [Pseudomonadota bacterium]
MDDRRAALAAWLRDAAGANSLDILAMDKLSGGAIQENWGLHVAVDGEARDWVLRTDAPSGVSTSHGRVEEFALLKAAHEAGVTVPEPLFLNTDPALLGKPFYLMARIAGRAEGHILTRAPALQGEGGDRLVERL